MKRYLKQSVTWLIGIVSFIFLFLSDDLFKRLVLLPERSEEINVFLNKVLFSGVVFIIILIVCRLFCYFRRHLIIKGKDYIIDIIYGDIFNQKNCKKVIPFDECFTTKIGNAPEDINPNSICGQFLILHEDVDVKILINQMKLNVNGKSKFKGLDSYESGRIVVYDEFLLMAFAKLDKTGLGCITYSEYLECLSILWEELDKYYNQQNVCIPVIGSGVTRFKDITLTKQELLDVILVSYKMSRFKIHKPNKLIIACSDKNISLNDIGNHI